MTTNSSGLSGKQQKLVRLIDAGRVNEARELARSLTRKCQDDAGALYALAGIHARLEQLDEVIRCCKRVTMLRPGHAGAHFNLAIGLQQKGLLSEAASSFAQCLRIEPDNTPALVSMGKLLSREGKHEEALECFEKAAVISPNNPDAFYCMGVQLQTIGRMHDATSAYQKALQIRPDYFEALNNLGHVYTEQGELDKALAIFESLLNINPESPEAYNNLGVVYDSMGKAVEAEAAYRKAIAINPDLTDTRSHLGFLLASEGRTMEALECFDANLKLDPGHQSSIAGKASALEKIGRIEEACRILEDASLDTTTNPDIVIAYCTVMLRMKNTGDAIKQAERLLADGKIPRKGLADLSFALGNLYEKNNDYSRAFHYFESANRLSPCTYIHENHVRYINNIIAATEKELLARIPRARHDFGNIVFIVGMPRSGTSLVEQILASHPDVFGAGELRYIGDIAASFSPPLAKGRNYPADIANLTQLDTDALAMRYIEPVSLLADESRVITDKMPHNFLFLGLINILFPKARVIHVTRSPQDNCLSLFFHGFNPMHSYTTDLHLLGRYYSEYQRLMAHWKYSLDLPVLEIRYEDIVTQQEDSTRRLLEFCGLEWSNSCLEFHKNDRFVKTPSYNQVRQPIYTGSVNRWKNYREFIAPLETALSLDEPAQAAANESGK